MNQKSKSKTKGSKSTANKIVSTGYQSISAMFSRQKSTSQRTKDNAWKSAEQSDEDDEEDVIFIEKVETVSPYFGNNNFTPSNVPKITRDISLKHSADIFMPGGIKKRKLSLFKTRNKTLDVGVDEPENRVSISDHSTNAYENNSEVAKDSQSVKEHYKVDSDSTEPLHLRTFPDATSPPLILNRKEELLELPSENEDFKDSSSLSSLKPENSHNEGKLDEGGSNNDPTDKKDFAQPYYFNNFNVIVEEVLKDETNQHLFNEDDMAVIIKYRSLSDAAKKMYIRLFSRKMKWTPLTKLNYPEIGGNLKPFLDELVDSAFLHNERDLTDLREILNSLSASDVKSLAKVYHVQPAISQKGQQIEELLKQTQRTNISQMFGGKGGQEGLINTMAKRAKKFISDIFKLCESPRAVFVRVMMLFSVVNTSVDEDTGTSGQGQLFQMLMVNMGKVIYPDYLVDKTQAIFGSRDDVLRLSDALQAESDLLHATEKGKWDEAFNIFTSIQKTWKMFESDKSIVRWNKSLPDYLRSFTATSVLYRLLSQGIDILQRRKDFEGAVYLLKTLLGQDDYLSSHRGYWWERLALNLDAHLKRPVQSLDAVVSGLADPCVRVGHRLALYQRGQAICERPRLMLSSRANEIFHPKLQELPKVHLDGRVLHSTSGGGPRFLSEGCYRGAVDGNGGAGDLEVFGVEEFVMDYYRTHGFPFGMHAEGSVVCSLFALTCWDILFLPRPNAFQSCFQAMPLDLYTDSFYERRKEEIDTRLENISESSVEDLKAMVKESWSKHEGVLCVGMNWEKMRSAETVMELVACIGPKILSGILKRYAHCPRHTRSGFPDLTLWNIETGAFKICEVKGPGDRLSHKQILWLDYLLDLGVDAEVCHVKAVAAKRLLPSTSSSS